MCRRGRGRLPAYLWLVLASLGAFGGLTALVYLAAPQSQPIQLQVGAEDTAHKPLLPYLPSAADQWGEGRVGLGVKPAPAAHFVTYTVEWDWHFLDHKRPGLWRGGGFCVDTRDAAQQLNIPTSVPLT
jgi:hypothetical protein